LDILSNYSQENNNKISGQRKELLSNTHPTATIPTKSRLITISEIKITLLDIKINYEEGSINIF
jgi:hypothetical protein